MGMYENLSKLEMTGDPRVGTPGLDRWCDETGDLLAEGCGTNAIHAAASLSLGFQYGIAYAREFGIPDFAKELVTLVEN